MAEAESLLGTTVELEIEGQRMLGEVTALHRGMAEVTVRLRHPVRDYRGVEAFARLKGAAKFAFDLTDRATYATMVVEVPLPKALAEPASEDQPEGAERRRYYRLAVDCEVEVLENAGSDREYVRASGRTVNLSGGGMLVQLDRVILAGVHMFRLHLPDETIETPGRIIPGHKGLSQQVAIEFVDIAEALRSKVVRFVFQRMRGVKASVQAKKEKALLRRDPEADKPRYLIRREKFYQPPKIRYW